MHSTEKKVQETTCTYGEVSTIFLGLNIANSDIFVSKQTENMVMLLFGHEKLSN